MKNILIIGGGAMGSAFTIPCIDNKNRVTITEPYSKIFIKNLSSKNKFHSALKINLSKKLKFRKFSTDLLNEKFDLIYIDGNHHSDNVLRDARNSFKLLNKNGFIIFDDFLWDYYNEINLNPIGGIKQFLSENFFNLRIVSIGYQLVIQKK